MALLQPVVDERSRAEISVSLAELRRLLPDTDDALLGGLVQTAHNGLMPASVHAFVSILIVHQVRDIIRSRHPAA